MANSAILAVLESLHMALAMAAADAARTQRLQAIHDGSRGSRRYLAIAGAACARTTAWDVACVDVGVAIGALTAAAITAWLLRSKRRGQRSVDESSRPLRSTPEVTTTIGSRAPAAGGAGRSVAAPPFLVSSSRLLAMPRELYEGVLAFLDVSDLRWLWAVSGHSRDRLTAFLRHTARQLVWRHEGDSNLQRREPDPDASEAKREVHGHLYSQLALLLCAPAGQLRSLLLPPAEAFSVPAMAEAAPAIAAILRANARTLTEFHCPLACYADERIASAVLSCTLLEKVDLTGYPPKQWLQVLEALPRLTLVACPAKADHLRQRKPPISKILGKGARSPGEYSNFALMRYMFDARLSSAIAS